jgi:hypothetical protein
MTGHSVGGNEQYGPMTRAFYGAGSILDGATFGEFGVEETAAEDIIQNQSTKVLYHYTDEEGMNGILSSEQLNPSTKAVNPNDARYGNGQYLSDIKPGTMTPAQLSRAFIGNPFQGSRFTNYVTVDVTGLDWTQGRAGVFVIPSETPLDLSGRIISSGTN